MTTITDADNQASTTLSTPEDFEEFLAEVLDDRGLDTDVLINDWWVYDDPAWLLRNEHDEESSTQFEDFCTHWLTAVTHRVVERQKVSDDLRALFTDPDVDLPIVMTAMSDSAELYTSLARISPADPLGRFLLRAVVALQSDVAMPLVLWLPNSELSRDDQIAVLDVAESWLVRRSLCKLPIHGGGPLLAEMIAMIEQHGDSMNIHDLCTRFLLSQTADDRMWPNDGLLQASLVTSPVARRLPDPMLSMLLTAIEERLRAEADGLVEGPRMALPEEELTKPGGSIARKGTGADPATQTSQPDNTLEADRPARSGVFAEFTAPAETTPETGADAGPTGPKGAGSRTPLPARAMDDLEIGPSPAFRRLTKLWLQAEAAPGASDEAAESAREAAFDAVTPAGPETVRRDEAVVREPFDPDDHQLGSEVEPQTGSAAAGGPLPRWVFVELPPTLTLMHMMPLEAKAVWARPNTEDNPRALRVHDLLVDSLGNLTLLESEEPEELMFAPWTDADARAAGLEYGRRTLALQPQMAMTPDLPPAWNEQTILERGQNLAAAVARIWPNPADNGSRHGRVIYLEDGDQLEFVEPFRTEMFLDMPNYGVPPMPKPPPPLRKAPPPRRKPPPDTGRGR